MKADFSGYATKNGLRCSDGRTIMVDAFKHHDQQRVPLVWQHQHGGPENVLGHALLENRPDGVYAYAFFNDTETALYAKKLVRHGDITQLSIYANGLQQRGSSVFHGNIREVSLVLAGANPGALIDNVNLAHGDGLTPIDDEAIIYTGLELEHSGTDEGDIVGNQDKSDVLEHAEDEKTIEEVYNSLDKEQKDVVDYLISEAAAKGTGSDDDDDTAEHSATVVHNHYHLEGPEDMGRNLFDENDNKGKGGNAPVLSHSDFSSISENADRLGSFKEAVLQHAAEYGIEDIDLLFPDAKAVSNSPELIARRVEWVADVLAKTKKSPFSRIKSLAADLTADEARAKGYVKGNLKKEEIIKMLRRVTTPTTIYKKQKLDRDDIIDIVDLDIIAWIKGEMRIMLDEEIARAILFGDGREPDDEDKIDEDHLRPIAFDIDMYVHHVTLPSSTSASDKIDAIVRARSKYKGSGTPTYYTTADELTNMLLEKDTLGRRLYNTEAELASVLRVKEIIEVEAMESVAELDGIIVNLADYTVGADKGGEINFFDDFDIDYNQNKYLIETRISGALTKPKSAVVIRTTSDAVVTPDEPGFNAASGVVTIPAKTGVVYKNAATNTTLTAGAQAAIASGATIEIEAVPASGYEFPHNIDADWEFTRN